MQGISHRNAWLLLPGERGRCVTTAAHAENFTAPTPRRKAVAARPKGGNLTSLITRTKLYFLIKQQAASFDLWEGVEVVFLFFLSSGGWVD